jgi:hypothetical protein
MAKPPTTAQRQDWVSRIEGITARMVASTPIEQLPHGLGDLAEVKMRVLKSERASSTVEGGCAVRVLRFAHRIRLSQVMDVELATGRAILVQGAYDHALYALAREIIRHENLPSPSWDEMLVELNFPPDPLPVEKVRFESQAALTAAADGWYEYWGDLEMKNESGEPEEFGNGGGHAHVIGGKIRAYYEQGSGRYMRAYVWGETAILTVCAELDAQDGYVDDGPRAAFHNEEMARKWCESYENGVPG